MPKQRCDYSWPLPNGFRNEIKRMGEHLEGYDAFISYWTDGAIVGAAAERDGELKAVQASEGEDSEEAPVWLAKYRWIRNKMMQPGEGDLRLYVKGDNHLWGSRVHCEWALSDMRNS